jgi:hypothetical protein
MTVVAIDRSLEYKAIAGVKYGNDADKGISMFRGYF